MSSPVPNWTSRWSPDFLCVLLLEPSKDLWLRQPKSLHRAELIQKLALPVSKITLNLFPFSPIAISPRYCVFLKFCSLISSLSAGAPLSIRSMSASLYGR